ncbi:hypothetical protein ARMGADRAFT_1028080 [Armillaria gallica]|uniref:Uncharacterized protein n=1 Tax=Armillaria gallica TaxID=47427 RepID=A0A2H3E395_ARMGA|nr:hypothetical protein ARMGADRAFT_1028080 [Armillaria gallica]
MWFPCPYNTLNPWDALGWQLRVSQRHGVLWSVTRLVAAQNPGVPFWDLVWRKATMIAPCRTPSSLLASGSALAGPDCNRSSDVPDIHQGASMPEDTRNRTSTKREGETSRISRLQEASPSEESRESPKHERITSTANSRPRSQAQRLAVEAHQVYVYGSYPVSIDGSLRFILPSSVGISPLGYCSLPPKSIRNAACCGPISGWLPSAEGFLEEQGDELHTPPTIKGECSQECSPLLKI